MPKSPRPIYASDARAWDHCVRQAWFLFHPPGPEQPETDPFADLIKALGEEHEAEILKSLDGPVEAHSVAHTQSLMAHRTPVIYQPKFRDDSRNVIGTPDFLFLTEEGYRVADAKLALSVEKNRAIQAQLGVYQLLVAKSEVQDSDVQTLPKPVVFLGDGEALEVDLETERLGAQFLVDMQELRNRDVQPKAAFAYSKCNACVFFDYCMEGFEARDDLTLSPAIDVRAAQQLEMQQFETLSQVAIAEPDDMHEAPYLRNPDKRLRIIQQARSLKSGKPILREAPEWPTGTMIHFDV